MRDSGPWASATDLAEYAYCPRALYYRRRSPDAPPSASAARGERYHAAVLGAERRRAEHPMALWAVLAVGLLLAAVGVWAAAHP